MKQVYYLMITLRSSVRLLNEITVGRLSIEGSMSAFGSASQCAGVEVSGNKFFNRFSHVTTGSIALSAHSPVGPLGGLHRRVSPRRARALFPRPTQFVSSRRTLTRQNRI